VPIVRFRAMGEVFADSIRRPRLLAQLLGAFAGLALLLAAVGTYGVLSYVVAERRREIGIRMALGASRAAVLRQVMTEGIRLTLFGVGLGLMGAAALSRFMTTLFFGVAPTDPVTLAAVVPTIALVAGIACALPAWRASRLDPALVFRDSQ
jgi:ABC-type antimicrobial peptide transport system permease subunit